MNFDQQRHLEDDRDNGVRFVQGVFSMIWITASIGALGWMVWRIFAG
jgi:hypothetical protein